MPTIRLPPPPTSNTDQSIWGVWYKQITDAVNRLGTTADNGDYSPTLTAKVNVTTAVNSGKARYTKVGNIVHVMIPAAITVTAPGPFSYTASIPIASDFTDIVGMSTTHANGPVTGNDATDTYLISGITLSDSGTNEVRIRSNAPVAGLFFMYAHVTYIIR